MKKFDKIVLTLFLIFAVGIVATALKDVEQDREAQHIQNNIAAYQIAADGDMQITLNDNTGYYFNIYKDTKSFKLINKNNGIYLYLNNNLSIKLNDADIEKIDITRSSYKNYKSSFITLHTEEVWELAKEETGIKNEIHSYIYYLINRC